MRKALIAFVGFIGIAACFPAAAQIRVEAHLDKVSYLAGEPVFVIWDYTNMGSTVVPFDEFYPYCPEPGIRAPFDFVEPTVFPYPHDPGILDCEFVMSQLKPGETHETRFLLNRRLI